MVEAECAGPLPWRKLAEALQPFADVGRSGSNQEHALRPPHAITDTFILGTLERIPNIAVVVKYCVLTIPPVLALLYLGFFRSDTHQVSSR